MIQIRVDVSRVLAFRGTFTRGKILFTEQVSEHYPPYAAYARQDGSDGRPSWTLQPRALQHLRAV